MKKILMLLIFTLISSSLLAKKIEINFWHGQGFHVKQIIEDMVSEYNSLHPDVQVNAVFQGLYQDMEVKLLAAAVTRQLPEVALEQLEYIDLYIEEGLIEPIDSYVKEEDSSDIFQVMMDAVKRNEKIYAVPFCMSTTVLFYNKDVFKKEGLDPDRCPETWEEMIRIGQHLTQDLDGDGTPDRYAISVWQNGLYGWAPILWANDGRIFTDNGKLNLTSREMVKTITMLTDLVFRYKIMPRNWTDWESGQAFLSGNLVMGPFSSAGISYSEQNLPWSLGVAPMPTINGKHYTVLTGSVLVNFSKSNKKRTAANDFIFWLANRQNTIKMHKEVGYIPVRKSALNSLDLRSFHKKNPNFKIPVDELRYSRPLPHHKEYFKINKMLTDMLQKIILQHTDPAEELAHAEKEINAAIK
ncbi:MAG: ABC transporter substrate-binding protein [Spirochaetota bacterium]|nr:MAG: ABC transporter substrate-binding protein [Spirochaetota bacterium]